MLNSIKNFFKQMQQPAHLNSLEAYIVSNNPQTVYDVDRLEREYNRVQHDNSFQAVYLIE